MKTLLALALVMSVIIGLPLLVHYSPLLVLALATVLCGIVLYLFRDTVREIVALVKEVW